MGKLVNGKHAYNKVVVALNSNEIEKLMFHC